MKLSSVLWVLALPLLPACGGGGGGGSSPAQLGDLQYAVDAAFYLVGVSVDPVQPTITGTPTGWSVSPALPAGLTIDAADGTLHGTPTAPAAIADYVVTASNDSSQDQFTLRIGVERPAQLALLANSGDHTVSLYTVDAATGALSLQSLAHADAGTTFPADLVAHPSGLVALMLSRGAPGGPSGSLSVLSLAPSTGQLSVSESIATGGGAERMALSASGDTLYVTSGDTNSVVIYDVDFDLDTFTATVTQASSQPTGAEPGDIVLDPLGEYAYVANRGDATISVFSIDPDTGLLSDSGTPTDLVDGVPSDLAVDPQGRFVYATLESFNLLTMLSIDRGTGALAVEASRATEGQPSSVAIHPTGTLAYVANEGSGRLTAYRLRPGESTFDAAFGAFNAGALPAEVTFDPSGLYAYVVNAGSHDLTTYQVDLSSGAPTGARVIRGRNGPAALAFVQGDEPLQKSPRFLYALNHGDESISSFSVDPADGSLTEIGPPVLTGSNPVDLAADPFGRFLFVANRGTTPDPDTVRAYEIDPSTGALGAETDSTVLQQPTAIAPDPAGEFVYVTFQGADSFVAYALNGDTGVLTLVGGALLGAEDAVAASVEPTGQFLHIATTSHLVTFEIDQGMVVDGPFLTSISSGGASSLAYPPAANRVYTTLNLLDLLSSFRIHPSTGQLSAPTAKAVGNAPTSLAFHPGGGFAYAAINDPPGTGGVAAFSVNSSTGGLTALGQLDIGTNPRSALVSADGRFLYAANEGSDDLARFAIDPSSGTLTLLGASLLGDEPIDLVEVSFLE